MKTSAVHYITKDDDVDDDEKHFHYVFDSAKKKLNMFYSNRIKNFEEILTV